MSRLLVLILFYSGSAFCQENAVSIEKIANVLYEGVDWVTHFIHIICVIIGGMLIVMAISFYKMHRDNPKYVPLDRPIAYLILGLVLMSIPIWNRVFGPTASSIDIKKKEEKHRRVQDIDSAVQSKDKKDKRDLGKKKIIYDIDAPLDWANDYDH